MQDDKITQEYLNSIGYNIFDACLMQRPPTNQQYNDLIKRRESLTINDIRGGIKEFEELYKNLHRKEIVKL